MTELFLCFADCDGSDPSLQSVRMERLGRSVCYSSAGSGSVPHSHKTGRHTKKLTRESHKYNSVFTFLLNLEAVMDEYGIKLPFLVYVSGALDRSPEEDLRDLERH